MPRSRVLLLTLLFPLSLSAAGRDVSAVRYAPSDSIVGSPSVAFNSNRFLTLWPMASQIYGALADPSSGTMPPAFPVLPFASASALRMTAAGGGYLAIWNQQDVPSLGPVPYLGTLTSEGVLERRVRLDAGRLNYPRLAFNGSHVLVVDQITNILSPVAIDVSLYDLGGALVRRFPLPVFISDSYAITETGGDFAVVTAGRSGINEWRVASDGTILSTLQIEPPPANPVLSRYDVAVASKSGRIVIAWMQLQLGTLSSAVIQTNGSVTRAALPNGGVPPISGLSVLPVGIGFVVVWNVQPSAPDKPAVFALRIDNGGALLDARPVHLGDGTFSAAASSADAIGIALTTPTISPATLIATVDASGISPRAATPTAVTPVRQFVPVITGNGADFTAAWIEQSAGSRGVVAGRVSHDGEPLDGSGIALDQKFNYSAAIAHSSSGALVVWIEFGSIFAARLTPFGVLLDATPLLIAKQFPDQVAVVWNGSRYFVVWSDGLKLVGAFVGPDGVVTSPKPLGNQTIAGSRVSVPDVAWDGRQFIVVFGEVSVGGVQCGECGPPTPDHVRVMRVSATGDAIDAIPVRIPGEHIRAHVASSGAESIIALDGISDTSTMIVRDEGGVLQLDPEVPLFRWFYNVWSDVAWDGATYTVGWQYLVTPNGPSWLAATRVSRSGLPFGSLFTAAGPLDMVSYSQSWGPSVAANDAGEIALVISEMAPPSYISRARLYLMTELAPMPPAPPAPRNAVSYFGGNTARIDWQSDDVAGFLIEWSWDFGRTWGVYSKVPGDARSATVTASVGNQFRISAFGPGGLSAGTITSIGSSRRRRAANSAGSSQDLRGTARPRMDALNARPFSLGDGTFRAAESSDDTIDLVRTTPTASIETVIAAVDAAGIAVRAAAPTAVTPVRQLRPVVTGNGAGFAAAWIEQSAGLQVGRVSHDGELLDDSGIALDQKYAVAVAVAHSSSEALVVWIANCSIFAVRLTPFGVLLDPTPITITAKAFGAINVTAAWDGSRYLVVWSSAYEGLFGSFVGADGSVTAPRLIVSPTGAGAWVSQPDVAWDGHQYLLGFSVADAGGSLCSPCGTSPPREVRLLRIAADGTPTDAAPLVVRGAIRAHIASSGSEFLVVLDSLRQEWSDITDVSVVTVRDDSGTMRLSDQVLLFHWFTTFTTASSDVAWDGDAYVVGWRYAALEASWLAASRVSRSGQPSSPIVIAGGRPDSRPDFSYTAWEPSFAIAVNDAGQTALIASDAAPPSDNFRARIYYTSELAPMPAAPPAPRNVVSYFSGNTSRIEWQSDDAPGFLIEQSTDFGRTWFIRNTVPGDARSATVYPSFGNLFRVSAFGPGGLSQATITRIGSQQRRRASR